MAKTQAVWALDVGQAALKALKLVPGEAPDQVVAEAFDFIEYPKILSQPDADPEQLVREALETFLERNDLKGCKVAISVPGQAGLVKFIKLPPVDKKRIPDIVKFEARQQIPFALEEVVWAYQQIGGEDGEEEEEFMSAEVGLFAMKRDQINRAILPFRVAGIEVDIVQMGPIALYNYITFDKLKGNALDGSVVLLDIGADNTDLIITDGKRIWQRNVPIGGNHFTRALTKEMKLTFAKAEHLKRNASRSPDPRAVFTAMRGVFNDFASEVNRSIGFYSSINRTSKISKVIGLGNGFKMPGLPKFLQQNLSQEIEKLEAFDRLIGDDVKAAPQFVENLPSFAVAYGLGVQGLKRGGMATNLLPPEIEQVRLIRAKKPWALAASALLMLGFAALYMSDYGAFAKVTSTAFAESVTAATSATKRGDQFNSDYNAAKSKYDEEFAIGKALVVDNSERAKWPAFLKALSAYFPDPVRDYKLDPELPADVLKLEKLRVHIDLIKPVWRDDVGAKWFSDATSGPADKFKALMHPLDRAETPRGEGWIIQVVGHHYNPDPTADDLKLPPDQQVALGPIQYLANKVLPVLMKPRLRILGVHHVALGWVTIDKEWTTEKGSATNNIASNTVPLLDRAAAPATDAGGDAGAMSGAKGAMAQMARAGSGLGSGGSMRPGMGGAASDMMRRGMMGSMGMPGMGNAAAKDDVSKRMTRLTRTDFMIQFIWQPPKVDELPKTPEEYQTKIKEIEQKMADADKIGAKIVIPKDTELVAESLKKSETIDAAIDQAEQRAAGTPATGAPVPGAPPVGAPPVGAPPAGAPPK